MQIELLIFLGVCGYGVLWTLLSARRIYEYPGFMTFAFGVFLVPQAFSLAKFPGAASAASVSSVFWMCALCLLACILGYRMRPHSKIRQLATVPANESVLLIGGACFLAVALVMGSLIGRMTEEETGGGMWTGKVTIYHFFTGVIFPAMAIFFRHALRKRGVVSWFLFALSLIPPLQATILAGRREATSQLFLTIGLVLLFEKRITPPRWVVPVAAAAAMLIIPATGNYRAIASTKEWDKLENLDLVGNFKNFVNRESILELRNAAVLIQSTRARGEYDWGTGYWDEVIWRFVPAQVIGKDLKDWLMVGRDSDEAEEAFAKEGFQVSIGSTLTGVGDSFREFGFMGAGVFALFGMFFRTMWSAASRSGAVFAQLLYIGTVTSAMRAVTHQTVDFLPGLIYQLIFVGLLYGVARRKVVERQVRSRRRGARNPATHKPRALRRNPNHEHGLQGSVNNLNERSGSRIASNEST